MHHAGQAMPPVRADRAGQDAYWYVQRGVGWSYTEVAGYPSSAGVLWHGYPWPREIHRDAGWPLKSLRSVVYTTGRDGVMATKRHLPWRVILGRGVNTSDLPAWLHAYPQRRLPLVPMPVGFVVNTLLYALGAWVVWAGILRYRRARLPYPTCARCGYNLTGLAPGGACPECGQRDDARVVRGSG